MLSWPNRITILRLMLVTPFVLLLLNAAGGPLYRYGAVGVALLIAAGDAADGILARRLGQVTRIGSILDPLADKAMMISALVTLSIPGVLHKNPDLFPQHLPYWVSVTLVSRDLFILAGTLVLYLLTGLFQGMPSVSGKLGTVLQFATIGVTIASPDLMRAFPVAMPPILYSIWGLTVFVGVISWVGYIVTGVKLAASTGGPE